MDCPLCDGTINVLVDITEDRRVEIWPDLDNHVCLSDVWELLPTVL